MEKTKVFLQSTLFEACIESINEGEAVIPDYYPEVFKVIRTKATPLICETKEQGGKIYCRGNIIFTLLYLPPDGKGLCSFTQKTPFSCAFDWGEEGLYIASCRPEYVSSKLISGRKATFKAVLSVCLKVLGKREALILNSEGDGLIALKQEKSYSCPVGKGEKLFKINEEVSLPLLIGAPLYTLATPIIKETRLINGKTVVKGEIRTKTLYVTQDDIIKEHSFVFPFSQIADTPEGREKDKALGFINICDMEVTLSLNTRDNLSFLEYDITANLQLLILREEKALIYTDCFSVDYKTKTRKEQAVFSSLYKDIEGNFTAGGKINFPQGVREILDCSADARPDSCSHENRLLRVSGSVEARILYKDGDGEICSLEKTIPFEGEFATEELWGITSTPQVSVLGGAVTLTGESLGDLKVEMLLKATLFKTEPLEFLTDIEILKDSPKEKGSIAPLSIYFAKKGESLWDIAKSFNISPERIKALNGCEDALTEDKKLILPRLS